MSRRPGLQGVLFDLDGTLLDTAPDMAAALNRLRADEGLAPLPFDAIRPQVSHGAPGLLRVGFGEPAAARLEDLRGRFLAHYRDGLAVRSRLTEGFVEVLAALESAGLGWGIVTNKPAWLTLPLLEALGLSAPRRCVVCGDTLPERKPHPRPLLHAASLLGLPAAACVYVGDAERDIQAARAAGMRPIAVDWGYHHPEQGVPGTWQADVVIAHPRQLLEHL